MNFSNVFFNRWRWSWFVAAVEFHGNAMSFPIHRLININQLLLTMIEQPSACVAHGRKYSNIQSCKKMRILIVLNPLY